MCTTCRNHNNLKNLFGILKKNFYCILCIIGFVFLLCFPSICIKGAQDGLLLWYSKVLPVLFPFFIISSVITTQIHCSPTVTTLLLGVLCGYPMGAKIIKDYLNTGDLSLPAAQKLLTISNHASPMFLIGYVLTMQCHNCISTPLFLIAIYWPPVVLGFIYFTQYSKHKKKTNTSFITQPIPRRFHQPLSFDESIEQSLALICRIGCYIMLYSILCHLILFFGTILENLYSSSITHFVLSLFTGFLEMTTGIASVSDSTVPVAYKLASVTAIASFGGCSSISQIMSTIKGTTLSMVPYICSKLVFAVLSALTILIFI